eukprot:SAG31_NODE_8337_length_1472_cov_1.003642_2_plen_44_part_00
MLRGSESAALKGSRDDNDVSDEDQEVDEKEDGSSDEENDEEDD